MKTTICESFQKEFHCMILLTHKNAGKGRISLRGSCKHAHCHVYKFLWIGDTRQVQKSLPFTVSFDKIETTHDKMLCRQIRGKKRLEMKQRLKHCKPTTLGEDLLRKINQDLLDNNICEVPSDDTIKKIRSEKLLENDLCAGDFEDFIELQKGTDYIAKVLSPFAVYMHSDVQFRVLHLIHKNREKGKEIVGHLDATGGVVKVNSETTKKQILYYPLVVRIKGDPKDDTYTLYAVTESLNSGHGVPDITAWLSDFNQSFLRSFPTIMPVFDRIISDFAYANFLGVLFTFQGMRIHQYIYICYKYAVNLTDYTELIIIVKVQMCTVHLTNSIAQFARQHYPSDSALKTSSQTKYFIECIASLMICKNYNLLKEIFRNMSILILSKYESSEFLAAKTAIAALTTKEKLMNRNINTNFRYDKLMQQDRGITNAPTVYDLNASIVDLPIYKGSLFYNDLLRIYNDVQSNIQQPTGKNLQKNAFYNTKTIPAFMKQYGGILPLWTGLTVPEGIQKYDNQPAELQMKKVKGHKWSKSNWKLDQEK